MKKIYGLIVLAAILASTPLAAQIITDRPDFADATIPVPVGKLQVESGYLFGKTTGTNQHTVGQMLVKTGLTERLELRFGVNSYEKIDTKGGDLSGFGDGSLGIKLRLLEGSQDTGPGSFNLTTILFSGIPSGQKDFRATHLSPGAMLTADMALSPNWTWAPFVQYDYIEDELGQYSQFSAGFSFIRPVSKSLGWYFEYYITLAEDTFRDDKNYVASGFAYLVSDDFQLDIYAGTALNGTTPDYFVGGGLSFIFALGE
jgi:hypothetical protein